MTLSMAWRMLRRRPLRTALFVLQFVLAFTMCIIAACYVLQAWFVLRLPLTTLGRDTLGLYLAADREREEAPPDITDRGVVMADLEAIRALPGVKRVAVFYQTAGDVGGDYGVKVILVNDDYLALTGLRPAAARSAGERAQARLEATSGRMTAWITEKLLRRLELAPGQSPTVALPHLELEANIVGVLDGLVAPPLFVIPPLVTEFSRVDEAMLLPLEAWPDIAHLTNGLWVQAEPGQVDATGAAITAWWRAAHPQSGSTLECFSVAAACQDEWRGALTVLTGLGPLAALLLALAAVGFVGTTMLNVDGRRAELATRRAVGADLRALAWQLVLENVLVLALAVGIAAPLAALATLVLTPGARAPGIVVAAALAVAAVLGGLCALLGMAYPLYKLGRDEPAAVLKQAD